MSSSRSRFVAAMTRTSTGIVSVPPTGIASRSWSTRSSFTCVAADISPISSRKKVPPRAAANRPCLSRTAPVNEPLTCPNSSDSSRLSGSAPQLSEKNGPSERALVHCLDGGLQRRLRRHQDDRRLGILVLRGREDVDPRDAGHLDVGEHEVGCGGLELLEPRLPALRRRDVEALVLEQDTQRVEDPLLVVDDENGGLHAHAASSLRRAAGK